VNIHFVHNRANYLAYNHTLYLIPRPSHPSVCRLQYRVFVACSTNILQVTKVGVRRPGYEANTVTFASIKLMVLYVAKELILEIAHLAYTACHVVFFQY